jgi:hypothetical protein
MPCYRKSCLTWYLNELFEFHEVYSSQEEVNPRNGNWNTQTCRNRKKLVESAGGGCVRHIFPRLHYILLRPGEPKTAWIWTANWSSQGYTTSIHTFDMWKDCYILTRIWTSMFFFLILSLWPPKQLAAALIYTYPCKRLVGCVCAIGGCVCPLST